MQIAGSEKIKIIICVFLIADSSDRPSALKVITLLLTTAAILVTSAAIKEAYFQ